MKTRGHNTYLTCGRSLGWSIACFAHSPSAFTGVNQRNKYRFSRVSPYGSICGPMLRHARGVDLLAKKKASGRKPNALFLLSYWLRGQATTETDIQFGRRSEPIS
jgi:hypothetical protein